MRIYYQVSHTEWETLIQQALIYTLVLVYLAGLFSTWLLTAFRFLSEFPV